MESPRPRPIAAHDLLPNSKLGTARDQARYWESRSNIAASEVDQLRREVSGLAALLASATLATITPENFSVQQARHTLLSRELEQKAAEAARLDDAAVGYRQAWDRDYSLYLELHDKLARPGDLARDEIADIERRIESMTAA